MARQTYNSKPETTVQITLLDTIQTIHAAWRQVTSKTIANCYRKGGFGLPERDEGSSDDETDNMVLSDLRVMWNELSDKAEEIPADVTLDDFINADNQVVTAERPTEDEIVTSVAQQFATPTVTSAPNSDSEDDEPRPKQSFAEANAALETLRHLLVCEGTDSSIFDSLADV
ncbi:tigger transposable element-derived protein 4-like [Haliotis rubra]|uniref:tigger transposable element-derived protein 4-like n=1 Tax=Haliotis rubra TaxID=36100 RepID=UPI001EE5161E|nr:tigger transposable element-derived protein 4-like [Haliotis rubra]